MAVDLASLEGFTIAGNLCWLEPEEMTDEPGE